MIGIKATKAQDTGPVSLRERYITKAAALSKVPMQVALLLAAFVLYVRTLVAGEPPEARSAEAGQPAPEDEHGVLAAASGGPALVQPQAEEDRDEEEPPARSGGAYVEHEAPAFVMLDSPAISYRAAEVSVALRNGSFEVKSRAGNDNLGLVGSGGGSTGGGDAGSGGDMPVAPGVEPGEDEDPDPRAANRAPKSTGTVYLGDVFSAQATFIAFASLLLNASDEDGDKLSVAGLAASSGTLNPVPGGWLYTPAQDASGFVEFTYRVTDGLSGVLHSAQLRLVPYQTVEGTAGDDVLLGTAAADHVSGGDGDDNVDAREGHDTIWAGSGDDHVLAGLGNDVISGGEGRDLIFGGAGNDTVWAGAGDDRVFGEDGDDLLHGEAGNDMLDGAAGRDLLDGGDGDDQLVGGDGDDVLMGRAGADLVQGGTGEDVLDGGEGADRMLGGEGDDVLVASMDGAADQMDGGAGKDSADMSAATMGIVVDLRSGTAVSVEIGADLLHDIEAVFTGSGDDSLTGDEGGNLLSAGAGDDLLDGGLGSDTLLGGTGNDRLVGSADAADDLCDGGEGHDVMDYSATSQGIIVDLVTGEAMGVEIGADLLKSIEEVIGGSGNDIFVVNGDAVNLSGGGGEDLYRFTGGSSGSGTSIHDFAVGDCIQLPGYQLTPQVAELFQDIYGERDRSSDRIRYHSERVNELEQTRIEADLDGDTSYELIINLDGHHLLFISENLA
jgi:Ca2+-binding RTX toxin-like protein